jgi:polyisoprenoid-binding protein YceI
VCRLKVRGETGGNSGRFVFDPHASQLTAHAFASGLVAVVTHNPECAIREFSGDARLSADTLVQANVRMRIKASSLTLLDEVSEYDNREIRRATMDEELEVKSHPEIMFESSQVTSVTIDGPG